MGSDDEMMKEWIRDRASAFPNLPSDGKGSFIANHFEFVLLGCTDSLCYEKH